MLKENTKAYLLVFILLFFSGNPLVSFWFGKYSAFVGLFLTILIIFPKLKIDKNFIKKYRIILLGIVSITFLQFLFLPFVSILAIVNLLMKILFGAIIINYLKDMFPYYFFRVVATLSLISLILFISINILGINLPSVSIGDGVNSYIVYGTSLFGYITKNGGMFWEPGAHAGVLTLCLGLNLPKLKEYWKKYKFQLIMIILALITSQSTTGYLVGFFILLFYYIKPKNILISLITSILLFSLGGYIYENTEFLKSKIESQFEKADEQSIGDFSNTRFGSLVFDWHYITKHPFVGNGFDNSTRYADHQYLFKGTEGDVVASGNGFSNYLACMGLFFILGYFILLWKSTVKNGFYFALLIMILVFLNLQGEQWFNYSLYLGLPFLIYKKNNEVKNLVN